MNEQQPVRTLALWFPEWSVTAFERTEPHPIPPDEPIAIVHAHTVVARSAAARAAGVRAGSRQRDAQGACPALRIVAHDPERDERAFLPLVKRIEALIPGAQPVRPGLCLLRARGPARYYGSEPAAADVLLENLTEHGITTTRIGVADGPFTAEQAAKTGQNAVTIVPPGAAAAFLAPLSVSVLEDPAMTDLLARLGVHTLGSFASLAESRVRDRFFERGARLHALAGGADSRPIVPRVPPPELAREVAFEPPLELAEQVAFGVRQTADAVLTALDRAHVACTEVRIEFFDERDGYDERLWLHPTCFTASDIVDRVRWQLQALWQGDDPPLSGGVALVRITPASIDSAAAHRPGLFGQGTDERLHHALSRVQGMLGHESVVLPAVGGGRRLPEREVRVPWGDRTVLTQDATLPWPGSLPDPLPTTVFSERFPVVVLTDDHHDVDISDRGVVSGKPAMLGVRGKIRPIAAWAGPWPLHEHTWDAARSRSAYRFHVVTADETAWLLVCDAEGWSAEGRYD